MEGYYSILDHFRGGSVLLTGASGYVGALVLEKLLRCTDVEKIYVMLRAKRGEDIQSRLQKMLQQSPVMHLLRNNAVLDKVSAISGDMTAVGLGINSSDKQLLQREVQTVVHCAADIRLEMGIQQLLQANYEGTRQLLDLARSFNSLQAFVHVSSAYTNMNATPGSLVHESIYRLSYGDQLVSDQDLVRVSAQKGYPFIKLEKQTHVQL
jgi:fatty acyl-CoA reductase